MWGLTRTFSNFIKVLVTPVALHNCRMCFTLTFIFCMHVSNVLWLNHLCGLKTLTAQYLCIIYVSASRYNLCLLHIWSPPLFQCVQSRSRSSSVGEGSETNSWTGHHDNQERRKKGERALQWTWETVPGSCHQQTVRRRKKEDKKEVATLCAYSLCFADITKWT